jgi:hypothetical protein
MCATSIVDGQRMLRERSEKSLSSIAGSVSDVRGMAR